MNFCPNCGNKLNTDSNFCGACGTKISRNIDNPDIHNPNNVKQDIQYNNEQTKRPSTFPNSAQLAKSTKKVFDSATEHLNRYTGEVGSVDINLRKLFSEVFKSHSNDEAEEIFISGTKKTTPPLSQISENLGKPWLFSRILLWKINKSM